MRNLPIIALITDFGLQDHYVASVKGVILSICPNAQIVDITHEVTSHCVMEASYLLWATYKYFPKKTIFLCIVDPGVGSKRKIIGLKTKYFTFIAPDNGLLDFVVYEEELKKKIEIEEEKVKKYLPENISATFHGRDVFAPIVAQIAKGLNVEEIGKKVEIDQIVSPFVKSKIENNNVRILHIDRFGNIITNIFCRDYKSISKEIKSISIGKNMISRWIGFYEEAPENTPCMIVGSSGLLEISVKNKNAAKILNIDLDTKLKIYWQ